MHQRVKRNFLGDLLHTLTGVATDDQLQAQLRLDEEIREKVLSVLTHQTQSVGLHTELKVLFMFCTTLFDNLTGPATA